jgi:hypothetical protein
MDAQELSKVAARGAYMYIGSIFRGGGNPKFVYGLIAFLMHNVQNIMEGAPILR